MEDVLSEVLRRTALRGTVYFKADFGAPWAMNIGPKSVAAFHLVVAGECWVRSESGSIHATAGDIVLFPHGHEHALLHQEDAAPVPAETLLADPSHTGEQVSYGGNGSSTTLICGHFERDHEVDHPLFATLPSCVYVPAKNARNSAWMATATELAVLESASGGPGSTAVVDRLAEVLLIQVLRAWCDLEQHSSSFLSALTDTRMAQAVTCLHASPAHPWTVDALAKKVGLSRSVLASRFRERVGMTPMNYLTQWRMRLAREALATTDASMATIAERVGYENEWSFAKAFKRTWQENPGAFRRRMRQSS